MIRKKNTTNIKEQELVRGILSGRETALRSFYLDYKGKIFAFISLKIDKQGDAEEVFSDTFLASIEALRDFTFSCSLSTFIYSIAKRKVIDYYRRRKIEDILFSRLGNAAFLVSHLLTPEQEYSRIEAEQIIEKILKVLLPRYERVLRLKYIEGLSVKEIAKRLSETVKQTEAVLFRARKAFVAVYTQWEEKNNNLLKKKPLSSYEQSLASRLKFPHRI